MAKKKSAVAKLGSSRVARIEKKSRVSAGVSKDFAKALYDVNLTIRQPVRS